MEVLDLSTPNFMGRYLGPRLPAASGAGCAAYDSDSGYVYYVAGDSADAAADGEVYRIGGKLGSVQHVCTVIVMCGNNLRWLHFPWELCCM